MLTVATVLTARSKYCDMIFWKDLVILFYEVFKIFTLNIFIFILRFQYYFSQILSVKERIPLFVKKYNLLLQWESTVNCFQVKL